MTVLRLWFSIILNLYWVPAGTRVGRRGWWTRSCGHFEVSMAPGTQLFFTEHMNDRMMVDMLDLRILIHLWTCRLSSGHNAGTSWHCRTSQMKWSSWIRSHEMSIIRSHEISGTFSSSKNSFCFIIPLGSLLDYDGQVRLSAPPKAPTMDPGAGGL